MNRSYLILCAVALCAALLPANGSTAQDHEREYLGIVVEYEGVFVLSLPPDTPPPSSGRDLVFARSDGRVSHRALDAHGWVCHLKDTSGGHSRISCSLQWCIDEWGPRHPVTLRRCTVRRLLRHDRDTYPSLWLRGPNGAQTRTRVTLHFRWVAVERDDSRELDRLMHRAWSR